MTEAKAAYPGKPEADLEAEEAAQFVPEPSAEQTLMQTLRLQVGARPDARAGGGGGGSGQPPLASGAAAATTRACATGCLLPPGHQVREALMRFD